MQNKICLIHQPAGIGDVFYLQFVARKYMSMNYQVIWPLKDQLMWIQDYITDIQFCSVNDNFPGKEYYGQDVIIISPQFVYLGVDRPHLWDINAPLTMSSKYQVLNLDHKEWVNGFKYDRNLEKENDLYYNVLGLTDDSEYVYVNQYYNTDNRKHTMFDERVFDYPIVLNEIIDGFTPFDWCKVFENAKEIYTRPTSISFIIDTLKTKAKVYYCTFDKTNYDDVRCLFNKVDGWID